MKLDVYSKAANAGKIYLEWAMPMAEIRNTKIQKRLYGVEPRSEHFIEVTPNRNKYIRFMLK